MKKSILLQKYRGEGCAFLKATPLVSLQDRVLLSIPLQMNGIPLLIEVFEGRVYDTMIVQGVSTNAQPKVYQPDK